MTYQTTLEYLFKQLPMFQRIGRKAFKKDLVNIKKLCEALGNPYTEYPTIHVAGTNGKGSTTHLIAALLQTKGLKVGVYTSPHYRDFRERIKINGVYISETAIIDFVEEYKPIFQEIEPSFFEITVALAFKYFADQQVDIAIIETGLGGRLDSTNVITPILSVITNISYDHQKVLGDTLPKIAAEKAGIIKPNVPVVIGESLLETLPVFAQKAAENNSKIHVADANLMATAIERKIDSTVFEVREMNHQSLLYDALEVGLLGDYQAKNVVTFLYTAEVLESLGWKFSETELTTALKDVKSLTNMIGRWDILGTAPLIIADSGHNEAGIKAVTEQLKRLEYDNLHIVWGMARDKDGANILKLLPKNAFYYFAKPDVPRGLEATILQENASAFGLKGEVFESVEAALNTAKLDASSNDVIFVGGSTFVVAEVV